MRTSASDIAESLIRKLDCLINCFINEKLSYALNRNSVSRTRL